MFRNLSLFLSASALSLASSLLYELPLAPVVLVCLHVSALSAVGWWPVWPPQLGSLPCFPAAPSSGVVVDAAEPPSSVAAVSAPTASAVAGVSSLPDVGSTLARIVLTYPWVHPSSGF